MYVLGRGGRGGGRRGIGGGCYWPDTKWTQWGVWQWYQQAGDGAG